MATIADSIEPDPDPEPPQQGIFRSFVNRIFGYAEADRLAAFEREAQARRAAAQAERERIGVRGAAAGLGADVYGSERQMEASAAAPALQSTLAGMASLGVSDAISGVIGEDIATETELTVPERVVAMVPVAATPFGRILGKLPIVGRLFGKAADAPKGAAHSAAQLEKLKLQYAADEILKANRVGSGLKADAGHRAASFLSGNNLKRGSCFPFAVVMAYNANFFKRLANSMARRVCLNTFSTQTEQLRTSDSR